MTPRQGRGGVQTYHIREAGHRLGATETLPLSAENAAWPFHSFSVDREVEVVLRLGRGGVVATSRWFLSDRVGDMGITEDLDTTKT